MFKALGSVLIIVALGVAFRWTTTKRPYKYWAFSMCIAAIFAGAFLILQDRVTEITLKDIGTIKSVAEKATSDANAIAELRKRMEAQSATVDLVAQKSTKASNLAVELEERSVAAECKLAEMDAALRMARQKVGDLDEIVNFTKTVIAANNDDRKAFDKLKLWAKDPSFPFRKEAALAYNKIFDEHSKPFYFSGFTVPWKKGRDPSQLTMTDLRRNYYSVPDWLKPALLEYIWQRGDLLKKERMTFLVEVIQHDESLRAVEYAGRYLREGLGENLSPLAIKSLLQAWEEKKDCIE
jgi:hypothetical protein